MVSPLSRSARQTKELSLPENYGKAGLVGLIGEKSYEGSLRTFARAVSRLHPPYVHSYSFVHSLNIPPGPHDRKAFKGDVDFAIASGNHLVLIDAKLWKPGFYWSFKLPPRDAVELLGRHKYSSWAQWLYKNLFGRRVALRGLSHHVNRDWLLSHNMEIALERYRQRLDKHGVVVSAMVVFVLPPGKRGFQNVSFLRWPGGIQTYKAAAGFDQLYSRLGAPSPVDTEITSLLNRMKRR